jgi:drug/metabolite transporter (DMT)-like permease
MTLAATASQVFRDRAAQRGILFVVAATACFGALDTSVKWIGAAVPLVMAMWARYLFQALLMAAVLLPRRGKALLRTRHPWLQVLRGLLLAASSSIAFVSLQSMPVGEFTAIVMLTPLVITMIAATSFGEKVSTLRWLLVAGGFIGAIVVIRPGADDFNLAMLLPLALVGLNAAFQLLTSKLARDEDPATIHFYTGVVATLAASAALPFAWQPPQAAWIWGVLALLGVFSTLGHYFLIVGYGHAPASTLTPFLYMQIVFATLGGWLVFRHWPDRWAVLGIVVIMACGALGTWLTQREQRAARRAEPIDSTLGGA